jgi:hypothetical protein
MERIHINDFGIYANKWNCTPTSSRKYIEKIKSYLIKGISWEDIIQIKINQNCFKN